MTVTIAQISDTHLSPSKPFFRRNFDLVLDDLNILAPDLVLHTGDISLNGADIEEDLREGVKLHRKMGAECRFLPGNHDVGEEAACHPVQVVNDERLTRYRRVVGQDHWCFDLPGWRILGINAQTLGTSLSGAEEQAAAIREASRTCEARSLAVLLHKPVADMAGDEAEMSSLFLSRAAHKALYDALGALRPALFLSGHVHQYRDVSFECSRHIWAPATSFIVTDRWQHGYGAKAVGYLVHRFHADGTHEHALRTVRGMQHHDIVNYPDAYGDIGE